MVRFGIYNPSICIFGVKSSISITLSVLLYDYDKYSRSFLENNINLIYQMFESDDLCEFKNLELFELHTIEYGNDLNYLDTENQNQLCINKTGIDCAEHVLVSRPNYFRVIRKNKEIKTTLLTSGIFALLDERPQTIEDFNKLITVNNLEDFNTWQEVWVPKEALQNVYTKFLKFWEKLSIPTNSENSFLIHLD